MEFLNFQHILKYDATGCEAVTQHPYLNSYEKKMKNGSFTKQMQDKRRTPSSSVYASGQSLNVNRPHPSDQREYDPNDTRSHQGIWKRNSP